MSTNTTNATSTTAIPVGVAQAAAKSVVQDFDILGAGLIVNLDSTVGSSIVVSGGNVTSWTDLKSGYVFSQGTAANQPTVSGTNGINFDGSDWLDTPDAAPLNIVGPMSIYAVVTPTSITNLPRFFVHSTFLNGYKFGLGNDPVGEARLNFPTVHDFMSDVQAGFVGQRSIIGATFTSGCLDYSLNGQPLGTKKPATGNQVSIATFTRVGANESGNEAYNGIIHQILLYNTKLTGSAQSSVEQGLLSKWSG